MHQGPRFSFCVQMSSSVCVCMLAMRRASWESNAKARADPFGGSGDIGEPPSSLSPQTLGYARRLREEPNSWYDGDGKDLPYPLVAQESYSACVIPRDRARVECLMHRCTAMSTS